MAGIMHIGEECRLCPGTLPQTLPVMRSQAVCQFEDNSRRRPFWIDRASGLEWRLSGRIRIKAWKRVAGFAFPGVAVKS